MSLGGLAALIAALAFLLLAVAAAVPIFRLRHTVDAATQSINDLTDLTGPILGSVNTTVENVNTALTQMHTSLDGVNLQLARIDTITGHAQQVSANVANLTAVVTAAASSPLAKAAAFAYGVRRASARRRAAEEESELREQIRTERAANERARAERSRSEQSRSERSRSEQSRSEQSRSEQSRSERAARRTQGGVAR